MNAPSQRPHRERGVYIPADEVQIHLANGWTILDIPSGCDDVIMRPPAIEREAA